MNEERFGVYQTPEGAVYIKDKQSPDLDGSVLYVCYSESDHKPGPVNALEYASAVACALNAVGDTFGATLHKV